MIKAKLTSKNGSIFLFGLTASNIKKLQEKKPIYFKSDKMGITGEILIMFGETEAAIMEELRDFVGPDTEIIGALSSPPA